MSRPCDSRARRPYWRVERALEIIAALVLIVVLAPLIVIVAALVAIDLGPPLTFWQKRPGMRGRPFKLYKFRTMAGAHHVGQREVDNVRLSKIGRLLRRTRLDELPELYNILKGEMFFVGPGRWTIN
jgi:lipopolysaccharide/colanic/teichoic acid biosynthesis glycosyltransferase